MRAVIMAGGRGTRLLPLTSRVPKPMLPLLDRPAIEYAVDLLTSHGIRDITMTLNYLAEAISDYFADGAQFGARIRYSMEHAPLGTAGSVKAVKPAFSDTFIVMSGDGLTDFDLHGAVTAHRRAGASATLLLKRVHCPRGFGVVETDFEGRIERFVEKPQSWIDGLTYLINTGIYIFEPEVLSFVPEHGAYDFGRQLFPMLLQAGVPIFGQEMHGYWSDIGTLQQYYQTQLDMIHGRVRVQLPEEVGMAALS